MAAKKKFWSYINEEWVEADPVGEVGINGFMVWVAPHSRKCDWKKLAPIPMSASVRNGQDAVKAARKALGKAVVGKRLVGEPVHILNPEEL
jgi:hypothetical protein